MADLQEVVYDLLNVSFSIILNDP